MEELQVGNDLQVDEGDVEGAMRPVSARVSRQAFSAGEALSGEALGAEIDELVAITESDTTNEAIIQPVIPAYATSSRRGYSPKTRRRSRNSVSMELNAANATVKSTHPGAATKSFLQDEVTEAENHANGPTTTLQAATEDPAIVLESPVKQNAARSNKVCFFATVHVGAARRRGVF